MKSVGFLQLYSTINGLLMIFLGGTMTFADHIQLVIPTTVLEICDTPQLNCTLW